MHAMPLMLSFLNKIDCVMGLGSKFTYLHCFVSDLSIFLTQISTFVRQSTIRLRTAPSLVEN